MKHGLYVEVEPVVRKFLPKGITIYYFCGGRGIGKTYSGLDLCRQIGDESCDLFEKNKFMYLRRTGVEAQSVASPESCPFKKYNTNEGYSIYADFNAKLGFGNFYMDGESKKQIGYIAALSTFSNLRGVDFSDVALILYDECIPESKNKKPLKNEGFLFLNMLETINRNRLLDGEQEVVVILLSNAIDLGSDLLSQLNLTSVINNMIFQGKEKYTDYARSLHIENYGEHKVSELKAESALYKFANGTGFNDRALTGKFIDNDLDLIKKVDLNEYSAFLTLENICVYSHKSNGSYHISQTCMPSKYTFRAYEKEKFRTVFYWMYKLLVVERKVTYDNYQTKAVFDQMIHFKPL